MQKSLTYDLCTKLKVLFSADCQTMAMQSASHAPKGQSLIHGMAEECPAPVASEDRELPFDLRWWARDIIFVYMTTFMVSFCSWLAVSGPDDFTGRIRRCISVYFSTLLSMIFLTPIFL